MPGGYIGVNLGLVLLTQSESELASVLSHEMAHVTQKHYARMMDDQRKNAWIGIAGLAGAVLAASKGKGDAAQGALLGTQAAQVQSYLNFSRDNETGEADRIGFQYLARAQFDPASMGVFMERLQRSTSLSDTGVVPGYLRTHPVTVERIADARSRSANSEFKLARESLDFHYVRALLRSYVGEPKTAVAFFESALEDRKFASEAATRYGLAAALLRARDFERAKRELATLEAARVHHPMIAAMFGQVLVQNEEIPAAVRHYERAIAEFPTHWQLHYDLPEVLLRSKEPKRALTSLEKSLAKRPDDATAGARGAGVGRGRLQDAAAPLPWRTVRPAGQSARRDRPVRAGIEGWRWRLLRSELRRSPRSRAEAGNAGRATERTTRSF